MASTDDIVSQRIISIGGLNTNEASLTLSDQAPGCATSLVNFEVSKAGGYRRINGYQPLDDMAVEVGAGSAVGPVLGVWIIFNSTTKIYETIAARANTGGTTYSFWLLNGGINWTPIITPTRNMSGPNSVVSRVRFSEFNFGSGNNTIFVDGVNPALWYDGTAWRSILSTNTGASPAQAGGNQVVDAPAIVTIFKNHVFLGLDPSIDGEGRFVHSAPNSPYDWTAASGGGQLFPGFNAIALKPFRDELYIFGKEKIKRAVPDATAGFVIQAVTDDIGCVSTDSVLEVAANLIFLSPDGIRPVAGTEKINDVELGLLSRDIQPIIDSLTPSEIEGLVGVVVRGKTQFRYFYGTGDQDVDGSKGIIGGTRINQRQGSKSWEFGELLGIRSSTVFSGFVNGAEVVVHGDYDGKVYRQEVGSSFNGENIFSIYSSPYLDFSATDIRKLMRKVTVFIDAEGPMTSLLGLTFNWGDQVSVQPNNYTTSISSGNSLYNSLTSIYDDVNTLYGGISRTLIRVNLQGSAFSVKFNFVNIGTDPSFTITGFVPEFSIKGRN